MFPMLRRLLRLTVKPVTIEGILGQDAAASVVTNYVNNHLSDSEGVIIISVNQSSWRVDAGGVTEVEAIGLLTKAIHQINTEGTPV